MSNSELRSPFVERVISLLPRGHEEALKQAFYNVAAICLFLIMAAAAMAVYFILEPFVKPLLWAVLVGSVLHPFKHKSVVTARGWLTQLKDDETLLALGLLSIPLKLLDMVTEWIGRTFITHIKVILSLIVGIYVISAIQQYYDLCDIISLFEIAMNVFEPLTHLDPLHPKVGTVLLGVLVLAVSLIAQWKSSITVHIGWILIVGLTCIFLGSLSFLLVAILLLLSVVAVAIYLGWLEDDESSVCDDDDEPPACEPSIVNVSTPKFPHSIHRLMRSRIVTAALSSFSTPLAAPHPAVVMSENKAQGSSNRFISHALWACIAVNLWNHMWLINLFPVPIVIFLLKSLGSYFNVWAFLKLHLTKVVTYISDWLSDRKDQVFPKPLQWLHKAAVFLDRMLVKRLVDQTDTVVTVVIIFLGLVLTISASVFTAVQIYGESVHLLQVGTRLVNRTLHNPEARQWLPQGADRMVDLGSVVDNAYSYGKTSIASFVKNAINEKDPARAAQIERAILEGLDRVQRAWLTQGENTTQGSAKPITDGAFNSSTPSFKPPPLLRRLTTDVFNVTVLMNYGRENIGSMLSILESVWTIMKGNLSLVFKSTTAVLSILLIGGTAILNFLVNGVVFLTALYYLLVASDLQYKPIQMMSFFSPGGGNTLGTAMEEAINTVCLASLKLAAFYGIWTWIIHTIFGVSFVVIPVALAAVLGAVPFLGTYWAALPAALDLWLAQSRGLEAILLMIFQFAPTMIVDASFYAEIKGGGHPYLTGLAVAGGIFWLGVEGAIIGPLLLCILLVGVSVYSNLVQPEIPQPAVEMSQPRWIHRRLLRTDTVG